MWYIAIDTTTDTVNVRSNYKVTMFTTNSNYLREIGTPGRGVGEFNAMHGLAVNESTGDPYGCDYGND